MAPRSATIRSIFDTGNFESADGIDNIDFYLRTDRLSDMSEELFDRRLPPDGLQSIQGVFDPTLIAMLDACSKNARNTSNMSALELDGWAHVICGHLLRNYSSAQKLQELTQPCLTSNVLAQALELIDADLNTDLSSETLAAACGMGPSQFCRAFKKAIGLTPHQFVIERRIERARDMLANSRLSIAEIAYAVGFSSQAHMTTTFKSRLKITPRRFRDEQS